MTAIAALVFVVTLTPAAVLVWALVKKKYSYKPKAKKC